MISTLARIGLFGTGSGFAVAEAALWLQSSLTTKSPMQDLIGSLGLPGAIASLALAFLLGAKAVQTLKASQGNGRSGDDALAAERRTNTAVERVMDRIEEARVYLDNEIEKTRHALPTAQTTMMLRLEEGAERRHEELLKLLERQGRER